MREKGIAMIRHLSAFLRRFFAFALPPADAKSVRNRIAMLPQP
jgi:hypothetical protein